MNPILTQQLEDLMTQAIAYMDLREKQADEKLLVALTGVAIVEKERKMMDTYISIAKTQLDMFAENTADTE